MAVIQIKRGTAAEWTAADPVLALAELGLETDTNKLKAGDGVTIWSALPYLTAEGDGGGTVAGVTSVNTRTGDVVLDKTDVALSEVDNTSDLDKPVSTATQNAIDALTKDDVGLGNVDNTSDLDKPISTATQGALDTINSTISGITGDVNDLNSNKIGALVEDTTPVLGGDLNVKAFKITSDTESELTTDLNFEPVSDATQDLGSPTKKWKDVFVEDGVNFTDKRTGIDSILSIRDGQIIVTDSSTEVTTAVDLGGTTPDPGHIRNVEIDGTGRYSVGPSTALNSNGLITREFINTPGQFFVINDIDGGVFTGGNRQCFGLVRETIVDSTNLSGRTEGLFTGGNTGGWSMSGVWYYTGGFPYLWTGYAIAAQTPQGSGDQLNGPMGSQTNQKKWWEACGYVGKGKKLRVGIADNTNSDQSGQNFSNRLITQIYVWQEILDNPTTFNMMPTVVQTNGAGWYTCWATNGDYENMGTFPEDPSTFRGPEATRQAGQDKGYRFRWSTFGNTTLNQLPYVQGVPSVNDQIAAATGLSYYLVYKPSQADKDAANVVLGTGTTSTGNPFYNNEEVVLLQFNQPRDGSLWDADENDIFDISHTQIGALKASPLFTFYPIDTKERIIESGLAVQGIESIRATVSKIILESVIGYYMIRGLDSSDRDTVRTTFAPIINAANTGQLQEVYDLVSDVSADPLYPQALLDALLEQTSYYLKKYPVF